MPRCKVSGSRDAADLLCGLRSSATTSPPLVWLPRLKESALRELDLPVRQQIEHERAPGAHGRLVRAVRAIDAPACRPAIELGFGRQWHDQIDLTFRMRMM